MVFQEIFDKLVNSVISFVPNLLGAIILLIIGWILGVIVGKVSKEILRRAKIDMYISKKPTFKFSNIISTILSWTIYLIFIREAVNVLALPILVEAIGVIISFLPGIIGAIIVLMAGYAVGEYVRKQIEESEITYSDIISKVVFFLVIYISIAIALPMVKIDPFLINALLLILVGTIGLGISIAIGLGLKDFIAELAKKYVKTKRLKK
jgi:hypothetical protein